MSPDVTQYEQETRPPHIPASPEQIIQTPEIKTPGAFNVEIEKTKELEPTKKGAETSVESTINALKRKLRISKKQKQRTIPIVRDAITIEVEHIMEEGLKEAFISLSPVERQEFKIKGEQTAIQIRQLLKKTHVRTKSILKLLFEWLKMLPGINRFFLEQEAKIKTEKILGLHKKYKAMPK